MESPVLTIDSSAAAYPGGWRGNLKTPVICLVSDDAVGECRPQMLMVNIQIAFSGQVYGRLVEP